MTQLPVPKPTAPFWDSNNSHFSSLSFLDRLWAPDKIVCLGLGAARQLLLPLAKSSMAQRGELRNIWELINIHLAPQGGPEHTGGLDLLNKFSCLGHTRQNRTENALRFKKKKGIFQRVSALLPKKSVRISQGWV